MCERSLQVTEHFHLNQFAWQQLRYSSCSRHPIYEHQFSVTTAIDENVRHPAGRGPVLGNLPLQLRGVGAFVARSGQP
jgi:hypothetical protein